MIIEQTRLLKSINALLLVLKHFTKLDIFALILNPETYLVKNDRQKIITMASFKNYGFYELGLVLTRPGYRRRGYARSIINRIILDKKAYNIYIQVNENYQEFWENFGFIRTEENWPLLLQWKQKLYTTLIAPLSGYKMIIMHRTGTTRKGSEL